MGALHELWAKHKAAIDHAKAAMQGNELEAVRVAIDEFNAEVANFLHKLEDEGVGTGISAMMVELREDIEGMKKSIEALATHASEMHAAVTAVDEAVDSGVKLPDHPEIPLVEARI